MLNARLMNFHALKTGRPSVSTRNDRSNLACGLLSPHVKEYATRGAYAYVSMIQREERKHKAQQIFASELWWYPAVIYPQMEKESTRHVQTGVVHTSFH